ncbi:flavin reductase family protein [Amycolatopsis sp. K13G38]|uniref:Flavin reductase family protein n=1 Tax=Amycolatopsis acididurans TaxID=2724524 RepID=A0ABX1IXQ9_9PSEU|nr:flavin reductase family protein [Amycolatopsis acididurans]NKQ52288.1 flavin reductase family protein [Amycolatopsis acididurans]
MMDSNEFRRVAGHFATGVTVVTARHEGADYGITLSAMSSLSVDPPMMLICVNRAAPSHEAIKGSGVFVAHVLGRHQRRLAGQFARPSADKFAGVECTRSEAGPLVIARTLAHFVCRVAHTVPAGTHTVFLSDVVSARAATELEPLVYYRGGFGRLAGETNVAPPAAYLPPEHEEDLVGAGVVPAAFRLGSFYLS